MDAVAVKTNKFGGGRGYKFKKLKFKKTIVFVDFCA